MTMSFEHLQEIGLFRARVRGVRGAPEGAASAGGFAPPARGAKPAASRPGGFSGIWFSSGVELPPGHTEYSWNHEKAVGMKTGGMVNAWTPVGNEKPPGHTDYSWEKVMGADAAAPSKASKAKPPAAAGKPAAPAAKAAAAPGDGPAEGSIEADLCKLDLRCGKILECSKAPGADSLYLLKVDVGEDKPRQVISSLVKHYKEDQLKDRQVVVYCNIKPGKLVGLDSEAMVLAATTGKGTDGEKCELLTPPKGTKEGTRAKAGSLEAGSLAATQSVKHISKVWGRVQPLLQTSDKCEALFNDVPLTMGGAVTGGALKGAPIY